MKQFSKILGSKPPRERKPGTVLAEDLHQSADSPVTSTNDGGGLVLTNVEVVVIFWGSYWYGTPAVSSDAFYQCFSGIVTGPYLTGLRQYCNSPRRAKEETGPGRTRSGLSRAPAY